MYDYGKFLTKLILILKLIQSRNRAKLYRGEFCQYDDRTKMMKIKVCVFTRTDEWDESNRSKLRSKRCVKSSFYDLYKRRVCLH